MKKYTFQRDNYAVDIKLPTYTHWEKYTGNRICNFLVFCFFNKTE